ncbi:MAG: outer membrane protein assembly factor BamB family protein [Planctomycetales bacterium]
MRALCSTTVQWMKLPIVATVMLWVLAAVPNCSMGQAKSTVKGQAKVTLNAGPEAARKKPVLSASQIIALRDVVYHERRAMVLLERARQFLREEKLSQAFDALQTLLGDPQELLVESQDWHRAPSDSFFLADGQLHSVRHEALQVFESLTHDQLNFYEKKYAETANSALQSARQTGRSMAYLEVARRCFPTLAGAQATDEAATRLLDRGEAALAANLWLRIIRSNVHRNRLHPRLFEKAATALFLSGDDAQARKVIADAEEVFGSVRFTSESVEAVAKNHPQFASLAMAAPESDPFGSPSNNASSKGSVPYLAPVWTKPLYGSRPFDKLANWETEHAYDELAETGVAVFPIITQGQLVVRDLQGVRSCDPKTGRLLWRFNATLTVPGFINELRAANPGRERTLIETAWTENSAQGIVTTDGKRIFAIDWLNFESTNVPGGATSIRASNRLVCLLIPTESGSNARADTEPVPVVKPAWTVGGAADTGPLADQLFLGAPRPIDDALFVISESRRDRELNLVKLEAATGRVVWIQKLGLVQQPSFDATQRSRDLPMALPAFADGMVICQPDAEIIVAVDAAQGELKWIYSYGRDALMGGRSRRSYLAGGGGLRGFPSTPLIHRESVLCLPQHSEDVHRLELKTGQRVWKVKRDEDAYLAAVTDRVVVCVQKDGMRGLSLTDGSAAWTARTGLPSGRGVRIDDHYILPLKSGGIASVELETGRWTTSSIVPELSKQRYLSSRRTDRRTLISVREHNLSLFGLDDERVPDELRPGNLLFHDGLVFSVGPQHVTAFSEAQALLDELLEKAKQGHSVDELLVAQLEVSANQEDAAGARLANLISAADAPDVSAKTNSKTVDRAKWLLRELIIRRLNQGKTVLTAAQRQDMIEQLGELSEQPHELGYALIEQAHWQAENESSVSAVEFARRAIDTGLDSFIPMKGSADCLVTADAYARDLVRRSLQMSAFPARAQLQDLIEQDLQVASSLDTIESLDAFLKLYAATAEAGRVRNRLADRLVQAGRVQQAELLILQNRSHPDTDVQAVAKALLISLWSRLRLSSEAGNALYQFEKQFSSADLSAVTEDRLETVLSVLPTLAPADDPPAVNDDNSLTGAGFVRLYSGDEAARQVFADLHPLDWKVRQVSIKQRTLGASNPLTSDLWKNFSRRVIYGQHSEFDIVRDTTSVQGEWKILDRLSGTERGVIRMPGRVTMPGSQGYRAVGHLMPVGIGAGMQAVSLLEYHDSRPFWSLSFPPLEFGQELIEPGPATPSVCVFQTRKHLFGIEPSTGRVLWRRSDLDLASGVKVDREAGLFGDEQVLVMFHADQSKYTLFSTQTGEIIRQDKMNVDFRYPHHVVGRKLFHVTLETSTSRKHIRIWDPLTNEMEFDEELVDRFYSAWSTENELALMTTDTRLRVFSADASKTIVDLELRRAETNYMSSLRVFSDDQNVYVNIQRSEVTGNANKIYSLASDSVVPVDHVHRGLLIAVSRKTGKLIWKTPVQQRSFIRADRCSLPFLVGLSRVSPKRSSSMRSLEVRVIDRMTGADFVDPTPMIQDKIVHYQIDRDAGELQLHGLNSRIDIGFSRLRKRFPLQEQPL